MCQSGIDGLFQFNYFQPLRTLRNPGAHGRGRVWMCEFDMHGGRDQHPPIQTWKNIGCVDKYKVIQGTCVSYDRLHLQAELPVGLAIPLKVFLRIFQFDAMAI